MPWTGFVRRRLYVMNDGMFAHSDSIYHVEPRAIRRPGGGCPFDSQDADVILRSSDGVDFHLHRAILLLVVFGLGRCVHGSTAEPCPHKAYR
jgi:hypothetical protein